MPIGYRHYDRPPGECLGGNLRPAHTALNARVSQTRRKTRRQARISLALPPQEILDVDVIHHSS